MSSTLHMADEGYDDLHDVLTLRFTSPLTNESYGVTDIGEAVAVSVRVNLSELKSIVEKHDPTLCKAFHTPNAQGMTLLEGLRRLSGDSIEPTCFCPDCAQVYQEWAMRMLVLFMGVTEAQPDQTLEQIAADMQSSEAAKKRAAEDATEWEANDTHPV